DHAFERALDVSYVGTNALSEKKRRVRRQIHLGLLGLLQQDRSPRFQFRWLDRHREPPAEARLQSLLQAVDLFRIAVTGEDHLLPAFEQRVEGMKKLLLRALLVGKELDVVDQQGIDRTVVALELIDRIQLQRLHHVGDEAL